MENDQMKKALEIAGVAIAFPCMLWLMVVTGQFDNAFAVVRFVRWVLQ